MAIGTSKRYETNSTNVSCLATTLASLGLDQELKVTEDVREEADESKMLIVLKQSLLNRPEALMFPIHVGGG